MTYVLDGYEACNVGDIPAGMQFDTPEAFVGQRIVWQFGRQLGAGCPPGPAMQQWKYARVFNASLDPATNARDDDGEIEKGGILYEPRTMTLPTFFYFRKIGAP